MVQKIQLPQRGGPLGKGHLILTKILLHFFWKGFLLMTEIRLTHQLRLVVELPLFTGFYIYILWDFFHQQYLKAVQTRGWQHRHHLLPTFEGAQFFFPDGKGKEMEGCLQVFLGCLRRKSPTLLSGFLSMVSCFSPLKNRATWHPGPFLAFHFMA